MKRTITGSCLAVLLGAAALLFVFFPETESKSWMIPVMGTVCECRFELDRSDSQEALKAVNGAFAEVMELANLYDPESELSQLNAQAHIKPFVCSQRLYGLLCESRKAYELSSGSFDISVKPLMDL